MADNDNNRVIITRIQQRRGLKQDLPQPLRPAEFGFTTDSRQVFIGGDSSDLSSPYNKNLSYFETTLNAQAHTESIAKNQIIPFTVPFIKYSKGKFDGISTLRQWEPDDARTSVTVDLACEHISSDWSVFSNVITNTYELPLVENTPGDNKIKVSKAGFAENPIRIGDQVIHPNIEVAPGTYARVTQVAVDQGNTDNVTLTIAGYTSTASSASNANVVFSKASIVNMITGDSFKSSDVIVSKNGIQLTPDANDNNTGVPGAAYDYTFDSDKVSSQTHSLILRTSPRTDEEVTVCYYSDDAVVQALSGIPGGDGKRYVSNDIVDISGNKIESFYSAYNIPSYLEIAPELVRLSTTTGLGFIGLERKHISSIAFSGTIPDPSSVTLGNLLISRNDELLDIGNVTVDPSDLQQYEFPMNFASENIFSPVNESGNVDTTYRYNRLLFAETSNVDSYIQKVMLDVVDVDDANAVVTVEVPTVDFNTARDANAVFTSGSNVITITTQNTTGVQEDDWVRIIDTSGDSANSELHDVIFQVVGNLTENSFDIELSNLTIWPANLDSNNNVVTSFTEDDSNIAFVNHGNINTFGGSGNIETTIQLFSPDTHFLETDPGSLRVLTDDNPYVFDNVTDNNTDFSLSRDSELQTLFIQVTDMPDAGNLNITGTYLPTMANVFTNLSVIPVLSVDLSSAGTVKQALSIVNTDTATIKDTGTPVVRDLFPQIDLVPGTNNQLLVKQDPAYSSVSVGGLEFTLFEDPDTSTLATLALTPGRYGREETVRGKLERWLNDVVDDRDLNLFSRIMTIGTQTISGSNTSVPATYTVDSAEVDNFDTYQLLIEEAFKEVQFCDRQEASNFNFLVNNAYSESLFDRALDQFEGARGLLNLKNNIELLTRESAILFGERELTFASPFEVIILNEQQPFTDISGFTIEAARYDTFFMDYSIVDADSDTNQYNRSGTLRVQINDVTGNVTIYDEYTSYWNITSEPLDNQDNPITAVYEPKFFAVYDNNSVKFQLEEYPFLVNAGADVTTHSLNTDLIIKYTYKRWSATDF